MDVNFFILLGIISISQSLILPGIIVLKLLQFKGSWFQKTAYTVALSLVLSYFLVVILVFLNAYEQWVLILIFLLESVFALWIFRKELRKTLYEHLKTFWKNFIGAIQNLFNAWGETSSFSDGIKFLLSLSAFILSLNLVCN